MKRLILALLCFSVVASGAAAQELVRIAAVVNDDVISVLDLTDRIKIAVLSTGLRDSPELRRQLAGPVLRTLIDESLETQEAKRQGVSTQEAEFKASIAALEKRNGVAPGQLDEWLAAMGIPRAAFDKQMRAQILWAKFVAQRLRPQVTVSEDEIDEELARLAADEGKPEYLISQIDLHFTDPNKADEVVATAQKLVQQLRAGANFGALATQFSQSPMAGNGGDLGWVREGHLRTEILETVRKMKIGTVSDPIRTRDGLYIVGLRDRRRVKAGDTAKIAVHLMQVMLPVPKDSDPEALATQTELAQAVSETVSGCADMERVVGELDSSVLSGDLGWVRIGDLPDELREPVAELYIGVPSAPLTTDAGVHVLMVCERKDPRAGVSQREAVRARLERERLAILTRRLLRDLRRNAFVDLRV